MTVDNQSKNNNKEPWKPRDKRFVAVLDIMGFKELVAKNSHLEVYEILSKINNEIQHQQDHFDLLYITTFSDSIFIFTKDDTFQSFQRFIIAATIISSTILDGIPMNGAIAFGDITVNKQKNIFFGQPIIDAHLLQESLFYYGVVFHNSVDLRIYKEGKELLSINNFKNYFIEVNTPFKDGNIICNNLNWIELLTGNVPYERQKERLNDILISLRQNVSGRPRKYIDNTSVVFNEWFSFCEEVERRFHSAD